MNISRRKLLATSAVAIVASGGAAVHGYRSRYPDNVIGNKNPADDVVAALQETVGPGITRVKSRDFIAFARKEFSWIFHPSTDRETFKRVLCTNFILNSNLPGNGFEIGAYEFQQYAGACNPFLYS